MADSQKTSTKKRNHRAKSYTSIYDIFVQTPLNEPSYSKHKKITGYQGNFNDPHKKYSEIRGSYTFDNNKYVTSEKYHVLNKRSSDKSIVRSTSTLFYDLDNLAKRHSYHCIAEGNLSNKNIIKPVKENRNKNGFDAKSDAIVQECATDIQPRINAKDSVAMMTKKVRKSSPNDSLISSEIYLKDSDCVNNNITYHDKQQKFWSYAKYRTEYTKPIPEELKMKRKERGKRIEDPCPCQLFSYACPCTDDKSLTKLAGNSKTVTVANQMISAMKVPSYQKVKVKPESPILVSDKETSAQASDLMAEYDATRVLDERIRHSTHQNDSCHTCTEINNNSSYKNRCNKKPRQVICPNCNERVEVITLCEQDSKQKISPVHHVQENSSPVQYSYASNMSQKSKPLVDKDSCKHEPPCELVPVCQILPTDQVYNNSTKCFKGTTKLKNTPRTIKVTKACRHHPPCTVAPSCQRLNVLKNNCEYIPPCLHRPRCINLPLCVPFSKTMDYDELLSKTVNDDENMEYPVYTPPKCIPPYQHESFNNNTDHHHHYHTTHNTCEYVSEYEPRFFLTPKVTCTSPKYSPYQMLSTLPCDFVKSNKSCQYECFNTKRNKKIASKESEGGDAIIYIRDVGCQFRNKHTRDETYIQSRTFSTSFDDDQGKNSYFSNFHTLRYEDKFTNPVSCGDHSASTASTTSIEVDIHCPSHGKDSKKNNKLITGFEPRQAPIIANCIFDDPILKLCISNCNDLNKKINSSRKCLQTHSVGSRKCFLKNKYKKALPARRRRKSLLSCQSINSSSRKSLSNKNIL